MKKNVLTLLLVLLTGATAADAAVKIDSIYYNIVSTTMEAEVTSGPDYYRGDIVIPETITYKNMTLRVITIGNAAFQDCTNLTSVTIPASVTSISNAAFNGCTALTGIHVGDNVTNIGDAAFQGCTSLKAVHLPNTLTTISYKAFQGCSQLVIINIPESVTSIGSSAFEDCSELSEIALPNGLKKLANSTFQNCSRLNKIVIPVGMTTIGKAAFMGCSALTSISFRRVTSIGEDAFRDCTSLEKADLPTNMTEINYRAFQGCKSLTTVRMGNSIESLFSHAFGDCPSLKEVYCPMEKIPSTSADVFEGTPLQQATLYVPASLLTAYKAVTPWKEFGQHTSIGGQPVSQQQAEEQGTQNGQPEGQNGQTGKKWTTIYVNGEEQ